MGLFKLLAPRGDKEGYTLLIDTKVAEFLKYLGLGAGGFIMLTQAPVIAVASLIAGYISATCCKILNELVHSLLFGKHCSDETCIVKPVLAAVVTAIALYYFSIAATLFTVVAGQKAGAHAREYVDLTWQSLLNNPSQDSDHLWM